MSPLVTVLVPTYNHERYLSQCLDSILNQATDFPFEILASDDASTDGTRAILQEYAARFPGKVRYLEPKHNLGTWRNFIRLLRELRSPYFALTSGDDFWCGKRNADGKFTRLQTQVDILEEHKDYMLCSGQTLMVDDRHVLSHMVPKELLGTTYMFEDFFRYPILLHCSGLLYRNVLFRDGKIPAVFYEQLDTPYVGVDEDFLRMMHLEHGPAFILPEVVSAYRYNGKGIYSGASQVSQNIAGALLTHSYKLYYRDKYPELQDGIDAFAQLMYTKLWKSLSAESKIYPKYTLSIKETEQLCGLLRELARDHANSLI